MGYSLQKTPTAPVQLCTYGRRVGCGRLSAAQTRVCSWPVHTDYRTASRPASSSVRSSYSGACSPCRGSSQPSAPARRRAPVGLAGTPCSAGARAAPPPPRRPPHPPSPRRPASGSGRRRRRSWASRLVLRVLLRLEGCSKLRRSIPRVGRSARTRDRNRRRG